MQIADFFVNFLNLYFVLYRIFLRNKETVQRSVESDKYGKRQTGKKTI